MQSAAKRQGLLRIFLDAIHEARIAWTRTKMLKHAARSRTACREFTRLINARSPRQVARMEAERGL